MTQHVAEARRRGRLALGPLVVGLALACEGGSEAARAPGGTPTPAGGAGMIREVEQQGYRVRLDLSSQVLRISVPEPIAYGDTPGAAEETLAPTLAQAPGLWRGFVSAGTLVQKAKQFDDGLYAAVELAAQQGSGRFAGKRALLTAVSRALGGRAGAEGVQVRLLAAGRLGQAGVEVPKPLAGRVESEAAEFLADELASKPLGFYTWSPELEAIFRQDRLLQRELPPAGVPALVEALRADAAARGSYEAYLRLVEKLTNPFAQPDLRPLLAAPGPPPSGARASFFPPSVSHEGELIKKLYGNKPIPAGFSLVDEMIRRIRAGELSLEPRPESGWYDYQTWAHEPMVVPEKMPEAARLRIEESYRKELLELFKGAQALARETHVKQLEIPRVASAGPLGRPVMLTVRPELPAEPLASFYLRRALGYRFVRTAIETAFGPDSLRALRRITPQGASGTDLDAELREMERLFAGAHAAVRARLGMPPDAALLADAAEATAAFTRWAGSLATDPDLGRDARMMVPVFFDEGRGKTKVWVFLGWAARKARIDYATPPAAEVYGASGAKVALGGDVKLRFDGESQTLAVPVTAEVYVSRLLDRDEFRRVCDTGKTRSAILARLQ